MTHLSRNAFYFLVYMLWLLRLIITVLQEKILFLKASSTTEKQPPDSLPWGIPLLAILGGSSPSIQVHVPGDMAVLMASSVSLNHKRIPQYTSTY